MTDTVLIDFLKQAEEQEKTFETSDKELVQHLSDLGYLNPAFLADFNFGTRIAEATEAFMREVAQSKLISTEMMHACKTMYGDDYQRELLRMVMDIDEGLHLKALPEKGEVSLASRIVHYRLDIMGFFDRPLSTPYSEYSLMMLQQLKSVTGLVSLLDTINALADIETFTRRVVRKHGNENCLLVCKTPLTDEQKDNLKLSLAFKKQLKKSFDRKSSFYDLLDEKVLRRDINKIDTNFLELKSSSPLNNFFLRLIQVHQWKDGFYNGLLDTNLGPVMLEGILEMAASFNDDEDEDDIKPKSVLAHICDEFVLFNALYFLERYMLEDQKTTDHWQVIEQLNQQLNTADTNTQAQFETNANSYLQQARDEMEEEKAEARKGIFKRVYYGIKGFFKKLMRIGKKLFRWLVNNVKKAGRFLKEFFKSLIGHIKRALQYFINGIKFIIGKGEIVSECDRQLIITNFSADMDCYHLMPVGLSSAHLKTHRKKVKESVMGLQFSLSVVGKIVKLLLNMASMVTWPLLLINLVKVFKELTIEYKEINVELNNN